jgi:hypothetical protein
MIDTVRLINKTCRDMSLGFSVLLFHNICPVETEISVRYTYIPLSHVFIEMTDALLTAVFLYGAVSSWQSHILFDYSFNVTILTQNKAQ